MSTKKAKSGARAISANAYYGYVAKPSVYTTNASHEVDFRAPFYQKYASKANYDAYPRFLNDPTNADYFGASNWNDLYYRNAPTYHVNLGLSGGTERANFRFFGAGTKDAGHADETGLNKYNFSVGLNMAPFKWLTVSSVMSANRLDRNRNRSMRDRFAEARYIPDLKMPISPNVSNYAGYLKELSVGTDLNRNTVLNGNFTLAANFERLKLVSSFLFDYAEGVRDYFVPSTLMAGSSFVSTYFGYNQRLIVNNLASYNFNLNSEDHQLEGALGQQFQADTYKYNYTRGYNGPSDFIKIIQVIGDMNNGNYLNAYPNFYVFRYLDKMKSNLLSFYGNVSYKYKNLVDLATVVRRDGASNGQPDSRWVTTPSFSATWHLGNQFLKNSKSIDQLALNAAWGRVARVFLDDRFAAGPQYRTEAGWPSEPVVPGYAGIVTASRPYNSGYVGYGIPLPYADRTSVTLSATMFKQRLNWAITAYNRNDKNQVINMPVPQELGYTTEFKSGLDVNNKGLELLLDGEILDNKKGVQWNTSLNAAYNKNKVVALPGGVNEMIYQGNKLAVGTSVGSYWLYTNRGIYNADAEIPVNLATNQKMTFNGIPFEAGDPKWTDYNGDYRIDENDKILIGDRLPKFTGGWANRFNYKQFDLSFNLIFSLGQKAINQYDAFRYDFANRESANTIQSVREINTWQAIDGAKSYVIYNPWSAVVPYRADQDLFLEDASYLKLRSVTLGYDLTASLKSAKFRKVYLYATAMNLFTATKFSGTDPELISYNGIYDGANMAIPRTFVLGFKLDL